jgi:hypothetical protein
MEMEMDVMGRVLAGRRHRWTSWGRHISSEVWAGRRTQTDESGHVLAKRGWRWGQRGGGVCVKKHRI